VSNGVNNLNASMKRLTCQKYNVIKLKEIYSFISKV